jgi:hypothetical protein
MGVKLRLVQYPWRSGWPSGVLDAVQVFVFATGVAEGDWAARKAGANKSAAITIVRTLDEIEKRFAM